MNKKNMNRRDYLKVSATAAAYTLIFGGVATTIHACKADESLDWTPKFFTKDEALLMADVVECIIPKTDTPGAKEALVDRFIDSNIANNFTEDLQVLFREGLTLFDEKSKADFKKKFVDLSTEDQNSVMQSMVDESQNHEGEYPHIFNAVRDLTVYGFFTSEVGAKSCLIYDPIPGDYIGCIDYSEINGVWALR